MTSAGSAAFAMLSDFTLHDTTRIDEVQFDLATENHWNRVVV
jgi:hypothetical protein